MITEDALERGRAAYARRSWSEAYAQLSVAAEAHPLDIDDLEHLALSAELVGRYEEAADLLLYAHRAALEAGEVSRAALHAFWLGYKLLYRGDFARGGGWIARAASLLEDAGLETVVQGYLELPNAQRDFDEGEYEASYAACERAYEIGVRFGDRDLVTMARLGRGAALVRMGEHARGVRMLDEAMVAVTADEVLPIVAGIVYCETIETCQGLFDLRRAQEWTAAMTRWCESQPDLVPFRGRCLLYRAELLQFHGAWGDADAEAQKAFIRLSEPPPEPAVGAAFYQQAELHRLRGEFDEAEAGYRQGTGWGRPAEPGLAQLRLAQGDAYGALAMIRRALAEPHDPGARTRLLEPAVEIMLANGDLAAAREANGELTASATATGAPLVNAMSIRSQGALLLAEGDAQAALSALRRAWTTWLGLEAPYEAARTRVLIGRASRALGDEATAAIEFDAARTVFAGLGAAPDLAQVDALVRGEGESVVGRAVAAVGVDTGSAGLTAREIEVLRLVAAGMTNRAIADTLVISEKTVARHVSNIFTKLDVSSRSAATAYAYEHGLQASST